MGSSRDRPPRTLCFSSSLKDLVTVFDAHFLSCFADVKTPHQTEDVNCLMTVST